MDGRVARSVLLRASGAGDPLAAVPGHPAGAHARGDRRGGRGLARPAPVAASGATPRDRAARGPCRDRRVEAPRRSRASSGGPARPAHLPAAAGCLKRLALMRTIGGDDIARALTYPALVEALEQAFRSEIEVPVRHHHRLAQPRGDATLLIMPAWTEEFLGCKLATVFPVNAELEKPSVYGTYLLMSGRTGEPLAVIDGPSPTAWPTGAAWAAAATYPPPPECGPLGQDGRAARPADLVGAAPCV